MAVMTRGFCPKCHTRVAGEQVFRDGKVLFRKHCPDCGPSETLISSDAIGWQRKRDLWGYDPAATPVCHMDCEQCGASHDPTIAFLDVTNRCNMNCPICIANIQGMGFEFHPPMEYFDKIFGYLGRLDPVPMVELFGGEPTVREDLLDIINLARKRGVKTRVITNSLRLADEEYCRKLCETGVRFRIAFDGRDRSIYERLRKNGSVYEKKLKAIENLRKYSRRKNAILCCAAKGVNENYIGDLIVLCHENQAIIDSIGFLPLTEMWDPDTFKVESQTTREDVEHMIEGSVPGGEVEFVPAGFMHSLRPARRFLKQRSSSDALMFGGVHPDCETMTLLVSDGQQYVSINQFLKLPLSRLVQEMRERSHAIERPLGRLDPTRRLQRWRAKSIILRAYLPLALRAIRFRRVFRGSPAVVGLKMLAGLLRGQRAADVARKHLNLSRILRVVVLPFEEVHSIDGARLQNCKAVFAYEDVEDGTVKTVPACTWAGVYRNKVLRKIAEKYAKVPPPTAKDCAIVPETPEARVSAIKA